MMRQKMREDGFYYPWGKKKKKKKKSSTRGYSSSLFFCPPSPFLSLSLSFSLARSLRKTAESDSREDRQEQRREKSNVTIVGLAAQEAKRDNSSICRMITIARAGIKSMPQSGGDIGYPPWILIQGTRVR